MRRGNVAAMGTRTACGVGAKEIDLSGVSQMQLNDVAKLLNGCPRQTLGPKTPEEVMTMELADAGLANCCT